MIHTRFESYCEKCEELAPEAIINVYERADSCRTVDTTIYCRCGKEGCQGVAGI